MIPRRLTRVVTVGEAMVTFIAEAIGPLRPGTQLTTALAGAELNVATTVAALGGRSEWLGVIGSDVGGDLILDRLAHAGVGHHYVRRANAATGLIVRERRSSVGSRVHYWRAGSAGSQLCTSDVQSVPLDEATVVHLTGITPALSPSASDAVHVLHARAVRAGATISVDVNYRAKLWDSTRAREKLLPLLVDSIVFAGVEEAAMLLGQDELICSADPFVDAARAANGLRNAGARTAVVKRGRAGALSVDHDGVQHVAEAPRVAEVDAVGAGDAFVGGYLSGLLGGLPSAEVLGRAVAAGAWAASTFGDSEVPPTLGDLQRLQGDGDDR